MKGTIKDLLNIYGVEGYVITTNKTIQIKIPSKYKTQNTKKQFRDLYKNIMEEKERPGNIIEVYLEDVVVTIFINGSTIMMVLSKKGANSAVLRMTGKLVIAGLAKAKGK